MSRIYNGKVESVRQLLLDTAGNITYEVWFKNAKIAYFQKHQKQMMPISAGDRIYFEGSFIGTKFFIQKVYDRADMNTMESEFEARKLSVMI